MQRPFLRRLDQVGDLPRLEGRSLSQEALRLLLYRDETWKKEFEHEWQQSKQRFPSNRSHKGTNRSNPSVWATPPAHVPNGPWQAVIVLLPSASFLVSALASTPLHYATLKPFRQPRDGLGPAWFQPAMVSSSGGRSIALVRTAVLRYLWSTLAVGEFPEKGGFRKPRRVPDRAAASAGAAPLPSM